MSQPLAIIQARLHSTRLPNKMLLPVDGQPLLWWAWNTMGCILGFDHVVIACPLDDAGRFAAAIRLPDRLPTIFAWEGNENDVLGRLHDCAHHWCSEPSSVILRITPDDFPVDVLRETCTLAELDHWNATVTDPKLREHIGLLFPKRIEINVQEDYDAVVRRGSLIAS